MTDVKVEQCDVDCAQDIIVVEFENNHAAYADSIAAIVARHRQAAEKAQQERDAVIVQTHPMRVAGMSERYIRNGLATAIRSQGHE